MVDRLKVWAFLRKKSKYDHWYVSFRLLKVGVEDFSEGSIIRQFL